MARRSAGCARASSISVARWVYRRRRASRSTAASSKQSIIEIAILHEGRSIAGARAARGECGAVSLPARYGGQAGTVRGARAQDDAAQGKARQAERGNGQARSLREAKVCLA